MLLILFNIRGVTIIGWGAVLFDKVVINVDLIVMGLEIIDEWIRERMGIHQRHVGGFMVSLLIEFGCKVIEMFGVDFFEIDVFVLLIIMFD